MRNALLWLAVPLVSLMGMSHAHAQWPLGEGLSKMQKELQPSPNLTTSGRFQVFTSPNIKGHTFMLDTDTGRVWTMKKDSTSGEFSLQRISVEQVDGTKADKPSGDKKPADK
jgi:hypothetical protein